VLSRIPKLGLEKSLMNSSLTVRQTIMRGFCVEWGGPVVIKKPKGIASDLNVTGQWGVVVRRVMNGTGVLRVYL
jgi:hypothetical protein